MKILDFNKDNVMRGRFLRRLNRFVGEVDIDGSSVRVHISDTGRLKEILTEGRQVYIIPSKNSKTDGKLLFVRMEDGLVLVNTAFHSKIAKEIVKKLIFDENADIKSEVVYRDSRIDFLVNKNFFIEVKGCNLLIDEVCFFPDAPTTRGVKHLKHLIDLSKQGYDSTLLILAFRDCRCFFPNFKTDKMFYEVFNQAIKSGVKVRVFKIKVEDNFDVKVDTEINLCEEGWVLQKISSL